MNGRRTLRTRMSARFAVVLAVALAAGWALTGTAAALEPGVFVDPGSPAGKEYGVPLSDLRGDASGHAPVGNEAPPLFGIGISPAGDERRGCAGGGPWRIAPITAGPPGERSPARRGNARCRGQRRRHGAGPVARPRSAAPRSRGSLVTDRQRRR